MKVRRALYVKPSEEIGSLKYSISLGPVGVSVQGDKTVFQHYTGGIIDSEECGTTLNHDIVAVGYGKDYFIVRNSWGPSWGE